MTQAIILAGGFGTRLRDVVSDVPKPMAPIGNRPFLDILLSSLSLRGVTRVVLSVGYMADVIQSYFGDKRYEMEILYQVETKALGTGGAIRAGFEFCSDESVFVLNGDTFIDVDLDLLQKFRRQQNAPIMVTREVPGANRYGTVKVKNHRILSFLPKGEPGNNNLINAGFYLLPSNLLDCYQVGETFSFENDFLPRIIRSNRFLSFNCDGYFIDIGIPEDYEKAKSELGELGV